MPGRLTTVVTGTFLGNANDQLNADKAKLEGLLNDFEAGKDLTEIGLDGSVIPPNRRKHSDEHFFGNDTDESFFPHIPEQEKKDIVRVAYIQALTLALTEDGQPRDVPKPIVSYWVVTGPSPAEYPKTEQGRFEAYAVESIHEVHVFILTPEPAFIPDPNQYGGSNEQTWLIGSQAWVDHVKSRANYGYEDPVKMPSAYAAVCQQVKGY